MVDEEVALVIQSSNLNSNSKEGSNNSNGGPISVLDTRRSSSPSTSTSSFTTNVNNIHQKWPEEMGFRISESVANLADWSALQPIAPEFCLQHKRFGVGVGLDDMLSGGSHEQDHDLLRWISGDVDVTLLQIDENAPPSPLNLPPQNPHKNYNSQHPGHRKPPAFDQSHEFLLKKQNQQLSLHQQKSMIAAMAVAKQEPPSPPQKQLICDQLFAAAELMLSGNFSHAQGILARLNHQLPSAMSSCNYNPIQRSGFYFKQALQTQMAFLTPIPIPNPTPTLSNGMFKMCAYKLLSEVSPIIQFINFTSNQTLLEALGDSDYIHIIDFDIGIGAQWASFIQELPRKNNNGCSLKITAFASPSTHHPVELGLMHENLSQFAHQIGISFQLEVVNFDSFDPNSFSVSGNYAIAVNFPIWSTSTRLPAIPSLLHFIKQVSPRIVVALDRGNERTDLPFPQYLLQGLQYYEVLLDSIDAANVPPYTANKIEMFLLEPQINSMVTGKLQSPEPMPHWKTLFTAGGYFPVTMSSFAEAQADCVVKRSQAQGSGFHVERRHSSLVLCWQNRQLMAVSAWRC